MANRDLSFLPIQDETEDVGGGAGTATTPPGPTDLVAELLSQLEQPAAPEPPPRSFGRTALGGIGDALSAFASVSSGGRVPRIGAFAAGQRADEQEFRDRTAQLEDEQRGLRNRIRVTDFIEQRRIKTRKEEDAREFKQKIDLKREEQKLTIESTLHKKLSDEIIRRNIDAGGKSLIEMSIEEKQALLGSQDPMANFKAIVDALPEDRIVDTATVQPNGTWQITTKDRDEAEQDDVTVGMLRIATELAKGGGDVSSLIKDKSLADAVKGVAESTNTQEQKDQARETITELMEFVSDPRNSDENPDLIEGDVNLALANTAKGIQLLMAAPGTTEKQVREFFRRQIESVNRLVEQELFSPEGVPVFTIQLKQILNTAFPNMFNATTQDELIELMGRVSPPALTTEGG